MTRRTLSASIVALLVATPLTVRALVSGTDSTAANGGKKVVLKLAHALPASHPVHASLQFMATRLDALSGSTVDLQVLSGSSQPGSEQEILARVRGGEYAAAKVSAGILEPISTDMAVFGMPYLFRDEEHYWNVLLGPIGKEILQSLERSGVHAVTYYDSGSRSFYTVSKPIQKPGDLQGVRFRVQPSNQAQDMVTALGGVPTPLAYGEVYDALKAGKIEGAENNPPSYYTSRHYEVAKHLTLDEHTRIPDVLVFGKPQWDGLTAQVRGWIAQAAAESGDFQRKLWRDQTQEALREVEKAGVRIYRPDQSAFAAAMGPMYTKADGTRLGDLAQRIMVAE